MATKHYGVLLFDDAAKQIENPLKPFLRKEDRIGYYFNCKAIDASGPLFHMTVESDKLLKDSVEAEIQIPYAFIKVVVSSSRKNPFGFTET